MFARTSHQSGAPYRIEIVRAPLHSRVVRHPKVNQKAEDENDDEDQDDWGRTEASGESHTVKIIFLHTVH
jgi:hypothetical protein